MNNFIIIFITTYFLVGAFSFHFIMPEKDRKAMSEKKFILIGFLLASPIVVVIGLIKRLVNNN